MILQLSVLFHPGFKDERTYLRASTLSGRVAAANRRSWLMEQVGHGESTCRRIEERLAWNLPDELFSQLSWSTGSGIQETRKSRRSPLISVRRTLHFGTLPSLPPCLPLSPARCCSLLTAAGITLSGHLLTHTRAARRRYFSAGNGSAGARISEIFKSIAKL